MTRGERPPRAGARAGRVVGRWSRRSCRPEPCDRAVVFAPAGELVPVALATVRPGGTVSLAGIHMSDVPSMPYELLWHERSLRSVANMTRARRRGVHGPRRDGRGPRPSTRCSRSRRPTTHCSPSSSDAVRGAAVAPHARERAVRRRFVTYALTWKLQAKLAGCLGRPPGRSSTSSRRRCRSRLRGTCVISLPGPGRKLIWPSSTTRSSWSSGIST